MPDWLRKFVLWEYARATWQYDVMVGLILAFIFLTPRAWFRDQPKVPNTSRIAMLPSEAGAHVFWVEAELLAGVAPENRVSKVSELLGAQVGEKRAVVRLEPILDSEKEIKGYMAFTGPSQATPRN